MHYVQTKTSETSSRKNRMKWNEIKTAKKVCVQVPPLNFFLRTRVGHICTLQFYFLLVDLIKRSQHYVNAFIAAERSLGSALYHCTIFFVTAVIAVCVGAQKRARETYCTFACLKSSLSWRFITEQLVFPIIIFGQIKKWWVAQGIKILSVEWAQFSTRRNLTWVCLSWSHSDWRICSYRHICGDSTLDVF